MAHDESGSLPPPLKRFKFADKTGESNEGDRLWSLPAEIRASILQYLTVCDAARMQSVSKTWKENVESYPKNVWQADGEFEFNEDSVVWRGTEKNVECNILDGVGCVRAMKLMKKLRPRTLTISLLHDDDIEVMEELMKLADPMFYSGIRKIWFMDEKIGKVDVSPLKNCHSATELDVCSVDCHAILRLQATCPSVSHITNGRASWFNLRGSVDQAIANKQIIKCYNFVSAALELDEILYLIENGPFEKSTNDSVDVRLLISPLADVWTQLQDWISANCSNVKIVPGDPRTLLVWPIKEISFVHRDGLRFLIR